jgi:glyoxylase-like metal-dependent hydrolase (beta-lactamase superfamily II)
LSEPTRVATELEEVAPGVYHWRIENEQIGGDISAAHAVRDEDGYVLIDPLPLVDEALARLEPVRAIVLTAATHQRSSWRYRHRFGAPVWLPEGSRATDEEPDEHYLAGQDLPAGLRAVHTPGPEVPHYSLFLERDTAVLFSPDLVMHDRSGTLEFVPARFHEDPAETRRSVERSLELGFDILCLAHGVPVTDDPQGALRELLERTA